MIDHLHDALEVVQSELTAKLLTHVPCLAHVIQLALTSLIDEVKITARNKKLIDEWDENNHNPSAHSSATQGDGAPWTLRKV